MTFATVGAFEVQLDGEELLLTHCPLPGARQLSLPDIVADDDPDELDDWATPATWAVSDWIMSDPEVMQECEGLVAGAGDVFKGGVQLHGWVFGRMRQQLPPTDDENLLERALGTVDWTTIADYVAPTDDWEPLTCEQREAVRALLPQRHVLWPDGQPTTDNETLLGRAAAGELPCPHCTRPLAADSFDLLGTPVLRLSCTGPDCGFEEF